MDRVPYTLTGEPPVYARDRYTLKDGMALRLWLRGPQRTEDTPSNALGLETESTAHHATL